MTEQEAIAIIKKNYPKCCKMVNGRYKGGFDDTDCELGQAFNMAIEALEEVQQYRAIDTIKGYKRTIEVSKENYRLYLEYKAKVKAYETIGTIEECRAAVEKQKVKKPKEMFSMIGTDKGGICPCCDKPVNNVRNCNYCNCGQRILWEV